MTTEKKDGLAAGFEPVEAEYIDEQDESVRFGWRIDSAGSLDWALSRYATLEREIEENEEMVAKAIDQLQERLRQLNDKAARGLVFFLGRIAEYSNNNREQLLGGGKKKSRELAHGKVGWRSNGGGLEVEDEAALLEWADAQPVELELVRLKKEPDLRAIKAYAQARSTDEVTFIPPGMRDRPTEDRFYVEAKPIGLAAVKGGSRGK